MPVDSRTQRFEVTILVVLTVSLSVFAIQSSDIFMYLRLGALYLEEGGIPATDPFLYSVPNFQWQVAHEWLAHLVSYLVYELTGFTGLILGKTLIVLAALALPILNARARERWNPIVSVAILFAILAACFRFTERSSIVSDFMTPLVVYSCFQQARGSYRAALALPVFFALWCNLHPGFVAGFVFLGIGVLHSLVTQGWAHSRKWVAIASVSVLATLLNPDGVYGATFPIRETLAGQWDIYRTFNNEWLWTFHPAHRFSTEVLCFMGLVVLNTILLLRRNFREAWHLWLMFVFCIYLGNSAIRFVPTVAWCLAILAVESSPHVVVKASVRNLVAGVMSLVLLKVVLLGHVTSYAPRSLGLGLDPHLHPIETTSFLQESAVTARVFNQHEFGGYLIWRLDLPVFYHGFMNDLKFYRDDYLTAFQSYDGFRRVNDKHNIGAYLLPRYSLDTAEPSPIFSYLATDGWILVARDTGSLLFLRDDERNDHVFRRFGRDVHDL